MKNKLESAMSPQQREAVRKWIRRGFWIVDHEAEEMTGNSHATAPISVVMAKQYKHQERQEIVVLSNGKLANEDF